MVTSTGNHPAALWPGVEAMFGRSYNEHAMECTQIFTVKGSKKAYEEVVRVTGTGLAPVKAEGDSTSYTDTSQADTTRYTNVAYSLGTIVTREAIADNLYEDVGKANAEALGFSMRTTKEVVSANVLNRGFNASYVGGDGKELFATDHPSAVGNQSNELAVAADFSEASLEDMLTNIMEAKNYEGLQIAIRGERLIVPPSLAFDAERVLKSTLRSGSDFNDVNAVRSMGLLPQGYIVNHYLTDSDAWFIKTDVPNGLTMFKRQGIEFTRDNDFDTGNAKAKAYERYAVGWSDWLGCFGTPGAA